MKLSIFSHCALDTISIDGNSYEQIGGAASYCGLMAREFKFDVNIFTKFGFGLKRAGLPVMHA